MAPVIKDKYSAVWLSHSSMSDYLRCPRAYFLKNVYRNPKTNRKMQLRQPSLALGLAVHDVMESLSSLPSEHRLDVPLTDRYADTWKKYAGKLGGFKSPEEESQYRERGAAMLRRVMEHPGPITGKAIKIRESLPWYWFSDEDNAILCGKIDWLEYVPEDDSVRVIDFKTGKHDEDPDSLQLPIYYLLATHTQSKKVSGVKYWYLDRDDEPMDAPLPDVASSEARITEIMKRIVLARKLGRFVCPSNGCAACRPYELIVSGNAEHVGVIDNRDVYIV